MAIPPFPSFVRKLVQDRMALFHFGFIRAFIRVAELAAPPTFGITTSSVRGVPGCRCYDST